MISHHTQVAIVGAGPAGLMLGHLLHLRGIDSMILENRSREHVIERVRAGVLEQGTVDLMTASGVGDRLHRESMRHGGIHIAFSGRRHHIDMEGLTGGRAITIYGQNEVVKDLIDARIGTSRPLFFEIEDVVPGGFSDHGPSVSFSKDGEQHQISCDFIAGCDGFHGICRTAVSDHLQVYEREYPFGWLGILAHAAPSSDELVYSNHPRGFALFSMRSHQVTRLYLQCAPDEDVGAWTDDRIWERLQARLGLDSGFRGPILERGVTQMRSFVCEPMQHGRLFLAGDAAHIVPPTGAKGLNLAIADVTVLAAALERWYARGDDAGLASYSERCLRRVWRAEHFSWWMTSMLHRVGDDPFDLKLQLSQLRYVVTSEAAARSLAENYVGLVPG